MAQGSAKSPTTRGYVLSQTVYYTSSDTWTKANYPGIKAISVEVVGGGGAGGGAGATTGSQAGPGGGGGGGGYAKEFILVADLGSTETVTIGTGGTGGTGGGPNGVATTFGSFCTGGAGGGGGAASVNTITACFGNPGAGGVGSGGDLNIEGDGGEKGFATLSNRIHGGNGGGSQLGPIATNSVASSTVAGTPGNLYGGGGGGGANGASQSAQSGGSGAAGICIVEIYI